MKKILAGILALTLTGAALGMAACGGNRSESYTVYAPDGAPALALANAVAGDEEEGLFDFRVVTSATITAQVTGESPAADFCVLPVNAAANLLGDGETYKLLGTVTNGNMYFLTTGDNAALTGDNLSEALTGKTVGVVQLTNVPGLTFQKVLVQNGIGYRILGNDDEASDTAVNLKAFSDASTVTPASGCDYYLCPEPAVSAKIKGTASAQTPFVLAGSLQDLYGGNGYPQAVLVGKNSVIESDKSAVKTLISYFEGSASFLSSASASDVVSLLEKTYPDGFTPTLNANTLTEGVIANCSVYFTNATACKSRVNAFLNDLISVDASFTKTVADAFYYAE